MGAIIIAGLLARYTAMQVTWLFIFGVVSALLTSVLIYHTVRLLLPHGLEIKGFHYVVEIAMTFFANFGFILCLFIPFKTGFIVAALVVTLVVSFIIGFAMAIPLRKTITIMNQAIRSWQSIEDLPPLHIATIDRLYTTLNDHLKEIQSSFADLQNMSNDIKTSSHDLSSVSEQMNASLEEVSSTIQHISKGAQEQSESITSIARSIEGLNKLTSSISSQVKMASVSSRRTTSSAKQGMDLARSEAKISKEIFEQTKFIEDKMTELRDQSTEIKKILDIITGINEQTDLLAINAAIEAARVGEQGRGFAVVADEIRNLAVETKRSSQIVENLILEINKTIQELSVLLTSERERTTESNELAAQTEQRFTGIVNAVDLVTDMISRINKAATNQSTNTKELVKQVEQIAQVAAGTASATEEVSASVEEQTASMEEFTSTAQLLATFTVKLDEVLKKLKIG
jgi:methyl-accepting chemotaxis protein